MDLISNLTMVSIRKSLVKVKKKGRKNAEIAMAKKTTNDANVGIQKWVRETVMNLCLGVLVVAGLVAKIKMAVLMVGAPKTETTTYHLGTHVKEIIILKTRHT